MTGRYVAMLVVLILTVAAISVTMLLWDSSPPGQAPVTEGPATTGQAPAPARTRPALPATRPATAPIRPRPFSPSSEQAVEALPAAENLLVTVVDAEERPVSGATVWWLADDRIWVGAGSNRTGADGTAVVEVHAKRLVVTAPGFVPVLAEITSRERMRVTLSGEITLRGKVTVGGAPPPEPLTLTVKSFDDPTDSWPETACEMAKWCGFGASRLPFVTGGGGVFSVRGLPRGSTATIEIPEGYTFAGPGPRHALREMPVACDGEPVTIDLSAMKKITGRIEGWHFDAGDREPLPPEHLTDPFEVRYTLRAGEAAATGAQTLPLMNDRFTIPFSERWLDEVDIQVWGDGRRLGGLHLKDRIDDSRDVGAIHLDPPAMTPFWITDQGGRPVSKARVLADGHVSNPTDEQGRTELGLVPGTRSVIAGAPGFKRASFALPGKIPETIEIRLEPAVTLVVRVRHENPTVGLDGLRVALSFEIDEATSAAEGSFGFHDVRGSIPAGGGGDGRRQTNTYEVRPGQDITASGFSPGQTLRVRVEDQQQFVILDQPITLPDDAVHPIELVVRSEPQVVRGTVQDEQGRPIAGAHVAIVGGFVSFSRWLMPRERGTRADGAFRFDDSYAPTPAVTASAKGYIPRTVTVAKPGEPVLIRLERARHLAIELTGGSGGRFEGQVQFEAEGCETQNAGRRGERLFWFETVPCRPGTVRVSASGGASASVPVGAEEARVSVPRPD